MQSRWVWVVLLTGQLFPAATQAQDHANRGAVLGGVTGALAGAAIGKQNDEATTGALIGGAVGLLAGASVGHSIDRDQARAQAMWHQQQQWQLGRWSRAVAPADVVSMTHSGLGDAVIITHIRANGVRHPLQVADVILLHNSGVSEAVITAMQQAPLATSAPAPPRAPRPIYSTPVIVQDHHYHPPLPHYRRYPVHYRAYPGHAPRQHHPGVHWHIGIGH